MSKHSKLLRFGVIGVINTGLDFGLLFLLTHLGMNPIVANYISTSVALVFSFFANRSYTFKATGDKLHYQLISFFIVTLIGLWVLQPLIILGTGGLLKTSGLASGIILLIGKFIATLASLTWNYIFYSRVVFKDGKTQPPAVL